jgi:hypothetical protein
MTLKLYFNLSFNDVVLNIAQLDKLFIQPGNVHGFWMLPFILKV